MGTVKDTIRASKTRLFEALSERMMRSGHFRRTLLRALFLRHVSPQALAYVSFADHVLVVDPRDHMIAFRLVSGLPWQRDEFDRALAIATRDKALKPGGWFIDVGANVGTQTLYALLSGQFCGAVAIEPDPHNASLLRRNIKLNGFADRVHVIEAAASSRTGTAVLTRDAENFGGHAIEPLLPHRPGAKLTVETRTVDAILTSLGIAARDIGLALIDVEGHEIETLKGMASVRQQGAPIVVEVTAKLHGEAGIAALRSMLVTDYGQVAHLRGDQAQAPDAAARQLATFDFGQRQTDVLVYNAR
jgi:FkbM family methyltransferase